MNFTVCGYLGIKIEGNVVKKRGTCRDVNGSGCM